MITSLKDLPSEHLLQLSMDGPDTNWSVLTMLHDNCCEKDYAKIIDILALLAYMFSMVSLSLVLRVQMYF